MLGVAGDVGADDFPKKIVDATVKYVANAQISTRHTDIISAAMERLTISSTMVRPHSF